MKPSLIALFACCALTSAAFAQTEDPGKHPPQLAQTEDPGNHPPQLAQTEDPGNHPPQAA